MPSNNRQNQWTNKNSHENNHMANAPVKRPQAMNQQIAKSVRPQLPRDGSPGQTRWQPGELPKGGFRSVFDFSETSSYNTKKSPTEGSGKKVY